MGAKTAAICVLIFSAAITPAAATDFDQRILDAHNRERTALGLEPLVWSDRLAADAAPWAAHLAQLGDMAHSDASTRPGEGENLWMGTAGAYDPEQMVGGWIGEKAFFQPGVFPDQVSANVGGDWHMVGHYTQIVWRSTREVGCALATGKGYDVLVCRYSPPGNILGKKPY